LIFYSSACINFDGINGRRCAADFNRCVRFD
jgi:hypothetical protein